MPCLQPSRVSVIWRGLKTSWLLSTKEQIVAAGLQTSKSQKIFTRNHVMVIMVLLRVISYLCCVSIKTIFCSNDTLCTFCNQKDPCDIYFVTSSSSNTRPQTKTNQCETRWRHWWQQKRWNFIFRLNSPFKVQIYFAAYCSCTWI